MNTRNGLRQVCLSGLILVQAACGGEKSQLNEVHPVVIDGKEMVAGRTLAFKKDRTYVFVIDQIHRAPLRFYESVKRNLAKIGDHYDDVTVIDEGIRCSGQHPVVDLEALDGEYVLGMRFPPHKPLPLKFRDCKHLSSISYGTHRQDAKHKVKNQDSISFYPPHFRIENGDVDLADVPKEKWERAAIFYHLTFDNAPSSKGLERWLQSSRGKFIRDQVDSNFTLNYRNSLALKKVEELTREGRKVVILPWGAAHSIDFYRQLQNRGFRKLDSRFLQEHSVLFDCESNRNPESFGYDYVRDMCNFDDDVSVSLSNHQLYCSYKAAPEKYYRVSHLFLTDRNGSYEVGYEVDISWFNNSPRFRVHGDKALRFITRIRQNKGWYKKDSLAFMNEWMKPLSQDGNASWRIDHCMHR